MAEEREFVFGQWLAEGIEGLIPSHRGEHIRCTRFLDCMRAARRERLLAIRSLLDAAIGRTEERPKKRATKIEVE